MKTKAEIIEALQRHYGQGYAYPCQGCPYGGKSREDACRFELTRDALGLIEHMCETEDRYRAALEQKDLYIKKISRTGTLLRAAFDFGELVYCAAFHFKHKRCTCIDFRINDEPERLVPCMVSAVCFGKDTWYELRTVDPRTMKAHGEPVRISPDHIIPAFKVVEKHYKGGANA